MVHYSMIRKKNTTSTKLFAVMRPFIKRSLCFWTFLLLLTSSDLYAQKPPLFSIDSRRIIITHQGQKLEVSLDCPFLVLDDQKVGGYSPLGRVGDSRRSDKETFHMTYAPVRLKGGGVLDVQLFIQWNSKENFLRKWVRYRVTEDNKPVLVKEIVLERLEKKECMNTLPGEPGQNYPVFFPGFFTGIEYPVSSVRIESGSIVLAHQPGIKIQSGKWYESRKAIYCAVEKGHEKEKFLAYISANRPKNGGIHVNYNSWWTSPVPYSEKDIFGLMKIFEEKMFRPYGASFSSFCIDMGWSNPKSIWSIDTLLFPKKFNTILQSAKKMNSSIGLWISPSNMYSPKSLDSQWAEQNGYETYVIDSARRLSTGTLCCLGGERYSKIFREHLVELVKKYEIKQLKLDGYIFTVNPTLLCHETDHGHEPGTLSIEPIAETLIETCRQIHAVSPETWIETTCMGGNPSPWWLFYVNSVIGNYGSDTPVGRIPCPVYRESYTSARDFLNIQGAVHGMTPISAQEVLGIIHQSPEPFMNDAVTAIMRGHLFLPLYFNPAFMDEKRWKMIAGTINWAKNNASVIQNTRVLLPVSWQKDNVPKFKSDASTMPLEPYGYSHFIKNKGPIELRNPWIKNCEYELKIDSFSGFSKDVRNLNLVSIYPELRIYARDLKYGDEINIPLAPYETLVLSASAEKLRNGLPEAKNSLKGFGQISVHKIEKTVIKQEKLTKSAQPDSNLPTQNTATKFKLSMEGSVEVKSQQADLLVLLEGNTDNYIPEGTIYINGKPSELSLCESGKGRFKVNRKLWVFLKTPLIQGENSISLDLILPKSPLKVSVWSWAKKPGNLSPEKYHNILPQPEDISIESVNLIEPFNMINE